MNSITVIGNVGQDPEIKYFESGSSKCTFSVADRQRQKDAPPIWWNAEVWGKLGVLAADNLRKGSKVALSGSIKEEHWEKDGEPRKRMILSVNSLEFLDPKATEDTAESTDAVKNKIAKKVEASSEPSDADLDKLPF